MLHFYTSYTKKQYAIYSIYTHPPIFRYFDIKKINQQKVVKRV